MRWMWFDFWASVETTPCDTFRWWREVGRRTRRIMGRRAVRPRTFRFARLLVLVVMVVWTRAVSWRRNRCRWTRSFSIFHGVCQLCFFYNKAFVVVVVLVAAGFVAAVVVVALMLIHHHSLYSNTKHFCWLYFVASFLLFTVFLDFYPSI